MKLWHLLPFTLLAGLLIGRWLPTGETRVESAVRIEATTKNNEASINNITRLIQIPDKASKQRPRRIPATNTPPALISQESNSTNPATNAHTPRANHRRLSPEDLRARMEEAKDLWRTRAELARVQMFEKLNLQTAEQQTRFDNAINTMNQSLLNSMQGLATEIKTSPEMTPEQGVRAIAQMTTAMTTAYDGIFQAVPQEKQADVGKMQMTDFIDPSVIEPLAEVQDKLMNMRPPGFNAGHE
jgi:hypothetical protein